MDIAYIQKRIDELVAAMLGKGIVEPDARFTIEDNRGDFCVAIGWKSKTRWRDFEYFRGAAVEALDLAGAYVAALPTPEQARMTAFMHSLSETIELGKKIDTEVDFVNPLVVLMEKLSKNALTHAKEPA